MSLAPHLRGRLQRLDAGNTVSEIAAWASRLPPGTPLRCRVVRATDRQLDLTLRDETTSLPDGHGHGQDEDEDDEDEVPSCLHVPKPGRVVLGRVVEVTPQYAKVSLGPSTLARVSMGEVHDLWTDFPLAALSAGTFVRGKVLPVVENHQDGGHHTSSSSSSPSSSSWSWSSSSRLTLSLRPQFGGDIEGVDRPASVRRADRVPIRYDPRVLKKGDAVRGWVAGVNSKGAFLLLPCGAGGRVKLSHLADGFVEDPKTRFPIGTCVQGKVLAVDTQGR